MDIFSDILAKLILSRAVNCLKEPIRAELVSQQRLQMIIDSAKTGEVHPSLHSSAYDAAYTLQLRKWHPTVKKNKHG